MKRLFTMLLISLAALSCEMVDETLDELLGKDDSSITTIPNNQIWYTSTDEQVVFPKHTQAFNVAIHSYSSNNGYIVITFKGDLTEIGGSAFGGCDRLESVILPNSLTTIGDGAFGGCSSLTSVTIPDSVTTIGEGAFRGCSSLQEFKGKFASKDGRCLIIDGVLNSFAPAGLTEYTIPDSVTTIGDYAFLSCSSLTSVTIPDSVTTIGAYAFYHCTSLTSVTIGDSVTTIGDAAFYDCSSLTSVTIPEGVTTIGGYAFCNCTNLQEFKGKLASEDGRGIIIDGVFESFAPAGLTEYTIPDSVTTIGDNVFSDCYSLASVTIPDSVTIISYYAFSGCSSLTSVTIGNSVTTIRDGAFYDCSSLTSVTIPDSVTTIGDWVFSSCESLTSVTIPDSVTLIGADAFSYCDSLTIITIPDSVTTIGDYAFYHCTSLTSVYCKAVIPPTVVLHEDGYWNTFNDNTSGRKIYVPTESVEAYKSASGWSDYASDIIGYNF